ncbi:uncharacterized protein LOC122322801 isoform X3 [Drosophila grimshawi]|uniref:uncharacterized protein LOC122322801 isoform X3 n=1 Tax=Drosophila grimshawi TaxID=7222 RepID=UPI001C936A7B|nr:uncharacterized protein LOC122322801 isoform X3 [Drosophila grimshawi]
MNRSTRRTYHDAGTEHQKSNNSRSASGAVRSAASYRSRRLPRTAGQHQRRTQRRASLDVKSRIRSQPWMNSRSTRRTYHDAGTEHQKSNNSRSASGAVRSAASYRSRRLPRTAGQHQRRTQRRASLDVKSRIRSQPWMNSRSAQTHAERRRDGAPEIQ